MTTPSPGTIICYADPKSINEVNDIARSFSIEHRCRIKAYQFYAFPSDGSHSHKRWAIAVAWPATIKGYGYWIAPVPADDEPILATFPDGWKDLGYASEGSWLERANHALWWGGRTPRHEHVSTSRSHNNNAGFYGLEYYGRPGLPDYSEPDLFDYSGVGTE